VASEQLRDDSNSAFSHSEALFEATYGRTMLLVAAGLIDPQDVEQTPESIERWALGSVGNRYWYIIHGLMNLKQRGVIKTPLTLGFFRYHSYSFWDRFAAEVMTLASVPKTPDELLETKLQLLSAFAALLGHGEDCKLYENWFEAFQDDVRDVRRSIRLIHKRIEQSNRPSYAFNLLPPASVSSSVTGRP
jgi:hypothetical protein